MGVSTISQQNKIAQLKTALANKSTKSFAAQKPAYMQMSGSIFFAPGVNKPQSNTPSTLNDDNIMRTLNEFNAAQNPTGAEKSEGGTSSNAEIGSASEGRAAADDAESQADDVKAKTAETQQDAKVVTQYQKDATKLEKEIDKDDKKFAKTLAKEQKELKDNNSEIQKLTKETEKTQKEVDDAQNELDSLMAASSFSISDDGTNPNQDKINDLQSLIGAKVGILQSNGKKVYSLQRSQTRTLNSMAKTNKQYVKVQQKNTKNIEKQESTTDKIINVATKIEQVSALVTQVGSTLNMVGKAMIAAGCTPWTAWMVPVGQVLEKVGYVTEMVGNYGQAAANITKTAAYAADGNLQGAMQSAAAAVQTGAAAVKSTTGLKEEFGKINDSANQATQKAAAKAEAKVEVQQQKDNSLKSLNKTDENGKSLIQTDDIVDDKGNITDAKAYKERLKEAGVSDKEIKNTQKNAFGTDINGKRITEKQATKATAAQLQKEELSLNGKKRITYKNAKSQLDGKSETAYQTGIKNIKSGTFKNTASKISKSSNSFSFDKLSQLGQMGASAALNQTPNSAVAQKQKKPRPDTSFVWNARMNSIAQNRQTRTSVLQRAYGTYGA